MNSILALSLLVAVCKALPAADFSNAATYSIQNRIIGGSPARSGEFPFQAGIRMHAPLPGIGKMSWWCGGSLIASNVVLTAANCVKGAHSVEVFLGVTDLSKDEPTRQVFNVLKDNIIMHEQYEGARARNDVALIKLPGNAVLNDFVQIVNLPKRSQKGQTFEKTVGWVSGWGMLGNFKKSPEILQYSRHWILSPDACERHFTIFHKETQMCLDGSGTTSPCGGDYGGPVTIIEEDGSKTLVGVSSYGSPQGCEANFPSGVTRITAFVDWIAEKAGITLRD